MCKIQDCVTKTQNSEKLIRASAGDYNLARAFVCRQVEVGRGDHPAVECEGSIWTYGDVHREVSIVARELRRLGVKKGDRVLLVLPDSVDFVAAFFGVVSIGAIAVPTGTSLLAVDYQERIRLSRPAAIIVDEALLAIVIGLEGESDPGEVLPSYPISESCEVIIVAAGGGGWRGISGPWSSDPPASFEVASTGPDDDAFWLWTSGTTGAAKAAIHQHGDWRHSCEGYGEQILGLEPCDRTFSTSKLYHAYGLGNGLMFPFHAGATTILFPARPSPAAMIETLVRTRPTVFFSVPTLYSSMLAEASAEIDLSHVRLGVSAAEPLPVEILHQWRDRFGFEILDGIGSTEVLHIYISPHLGSVVPGSTGRPVPGYEIRLTDENGDPTRMGEVGDLWVRGLSMASGYWEQAELSATRFVDGWFHTGDKFRCDESGNYWYAGRSDDMFRVSGQWVSPIEVENALLQHPEVRDAAVVAFEDDNGLLKPRAFVILVSGADPGSELAEVLKAHVKRLITPYKYPRRIVFVDDFPRSPTGKVLRHVLRRTLA